MTRRLPSEVVTRAVAGSTLEWKLTDPMAFGLTTASPLQRAVCRAIDGEPMDDLADLPVVRRAFGAMPTEKPKEAALLSGIRTAKSLIAGCLGFHMAVSCDVSSLRVGEVPRVSVVSLRKDLADVVMGHLVGSLMASKLLKSFVIGDPDTESVMIRHPSGCPIEIKVVAGARAGASLVARWSAGAIFDEFPRMVGADEAVVNWDDSRQAVRHRLLSNAMLFHIGSPWAPYGPAFELVTKHHGKPSKDMIVIRATAPEMNPVYWTPQRVADAKAADPDSYRTDVLAEFASPDEAFYSSESVDKCTRKEQLIVGPKTGNTYYAAMDPATRGNGWTLAIATREGGRTVVVRAEEWTGSREDPLNPADVLAEIAGICAAYKITAVDSDQVMGDALVAIGRQVGIRVVQWRYTEPERAKKHVAIRTRMDMGQVELPPVPRMRTDLLHVRKKITPGGIGVGLPQTSDGRHCDWAPTLMLVLSRLLPEPVAVREGKRGDDPETARMREAVKKRFATREW